MARLSEGAIVVNAIRLAGTDLDHVLLKASFRKLLKDHRMLGLLDLIVDGSNEQEAVQEWFIGDDLWTPQERRRGLPIGNLTSQWFTNRYLNDLDHTMTNSLKVGGYVRYCDDFVLLDDDRKRLDSLEEEVAALLAEKRLRLHQGKRAVIPARNGLTFVGYRVWGSHRVLPRASVRQFRRRLRWLRKAYARCQIGWLEVWPRLARWMGHARRADSEHLLERLSEDWVFARARPND